MKRKYKIQVLNLTLIIFFTTLIVFSFTACAKAAPKFETFKVERGNIIDSVTASGTVDSSEVKNYSLQVSGKVLNALKKGETFKSGQVLISVDNRRNEILVSQAEKSLAVAENSLKIAKINYQQALDANHIAIQLADLNAQKAQEAAESALLSLENANRSADLAYESAISSLENIKNTYSWSVKSAKSALDEAERLLSAGPSAGPPAVTLDDLEYNVKIAEERWELAKAEQQSSISSGEDNIGSADIQSSGSIDSAQNSYEQSLIGQSSTYWSNLNSTQTAQTQIKLTAANIKQAQTQLELSNINLELTKLELDKNQISAPFDGIVLSSTFSAGESAGTGMTAISVISSQFIIKADINETDIAKLNPGQKVEMTLDAYPDKLLEGEIAEISPIAKSLAGIVSFEIKVKPDDSAQSYLKYGLSANVTIIISKVENVLYGPLQSVYEESGKKYVDVLTENNESKKVEITTGNSNYDYIEIRSGLGQGDEIIISVIEEAAASGNMFGP